MVEDSEEKTPLVTKVLAKCGVRYTHLVQRTPPSLQRSICKTVNPKLGCPRRLLGKEAELWTKARGVEQRNAGLAAVRALDPSNGVVYFGDDDNTYTLEIFELMRQTEKVSVWPVGLSGGVMYEGPKVENNVVTGFYVGWQPTRPFPIDMAGFAINVAEIMARPSLKFDATATRGYLESTFLLQIIPSKEHMEPLLSDCECVLVWHTRTQAPDLKWDGKVEKPPLEV
eukprot:m.100871 g.100871  ORF g.100871 m.100871 type:complete len:227 (-) comp18691_c0_seq1:11-691(-)